MILETVKFLREAHKERQFYYRVIPCNICDEYGIFLYQGESHPEIFDMYI